jgi:hypothetical protein
LNGPDFSGTVYIVFSFDDHIVVIVYRNITLVVTEIKCFSRIGMIHIADIVKVEPFVQEGYFVDILSMLWRDL